MKKIIKEYGLLIVAIVVILSMLWFVKIGSSDTGDKIFAFNNKLGGELTESKAIEHTHSFIKFSTPEDCITDGYDYQKCIICNKQIKVNRDATGHSMTAVVLKEPTYREEGLREYKCETCTYTYQAPIARLIDDEAPTCKIKVGTSFWENIINKVTFGVLFKDSQQVTIEANDTKSGVVSIKYYISRDRELGADELDSVAWQDYTGTFTLETNQQVVLYARAEDFQGNTTIVGTDGILLDNTPPQIEGITNNGEYYVGTLTITKPSDATMTINGTPIDGSYTFNNEGNYVVIAKDKVGNTTTYNLKIKKYTTSLSLSTSTVNITDMTDTNVTITLINGQSWEATSNNTNIATVTRSGNGSSIVIRGINEGTAKVTITSAVNNKYTGATKEITVNVTHQHNYSAYSRTKDPTCTEAGKDSRTCSKCGNIDTKTVDALGHNEVNGGTANIHTKCSRCQVTLKDSSKHVYTSSVTKQPTCTTKGTHKYSCVCGYSYTADDINALGHNYVWKTDVEPTCTENGVKSQYCTRCNDRINITTIDKLGHNYENGVCTRCGATLGIGEYFTFAGYLWVIAEQPSSNYVVLQSTGVTSGAWPGYIMSKFGNGDYYGSNIDGQDISTYNPTMSMLYNSIKSAEYTSASYGKGLFLVSSDKCMIDNYRKALRLAAINFEDTSNNYSYFTWLGNISVSSIARGVNSDGNIANQYQSISEGIAPAFNLDLTKVKVEGNSIIIK